MKFIGRGRTPGRARGHGRHDAAVQQRRVRCSIRSSASGTVVVLQPNETVRIDLVTGVAETREAVTALIGEVPRPPPGRPRLRAGLDAQPGPAAAAQRHRGRRPGLRPTGRLDHLRSAAHRAPRPSVLARNRRGQSGLWGYGISGDLPIVLVRIRDRRHIELVRQAVQAHAYWRLKGLAVDLVIWNEDDSVYRQTLQDAIMDLVAASPEAALVDKPGGIFVRRGEQMSEEDRALLQTVARVVLCDDARHARRAGRSRAAATRSCRSALRSRRAAERARAASLEAPAARPRVLQRPGRLQPRRPRVRHHPGAGTDDAGAVGQRDRQPAVRHRRLRERQRLHLVRRTATSSG